MKKILIIEDHELTRGLVNRILSKRGYEVIEAADGLEGLRKANEEKPDLIILDVVLPHIDGMEACRMLTSGAETQDIPVIILTSRTTLSDVKMGMEAGAVDYVKKPFDEVEFLARVGSAIKIKEFKDQISILKAKLSEITTTDDLTGLKNAGFFWEYFSREVTKFNRIRKPLSIVILDVDDFKNINDAFGHLAGDRVLVKVADILRRNVRQYDLVARYGGEEFVVVLVDTDEEEAFGMVEKIRGAIESEVFTEEKKSFSLSVSAGVATLGENTPEEMRRAIAMFEWADHALYRAKETGKGKTVVANDADVKLEVAQQKD
ncbi:MAG: diguanylate cyclase [Deltaproteobacteria bacterium]|nr:diguanylate cyclase [Candidatus Zymogenaceae bacterium]